MTTGSEDCPCINASDIISPYALQSCKQGSDAAIQCFPVDYGSNFCKAHDLDVNLECTMANSPEDRPKFCEQKWCYVDFHKCKNSPMRMYRSDFFPDADLFFSYETCNDTSSEWLDYRTTSSIRNKNLTMVVPTIYFPYIFKQDEEGEIIPIGWGTKEYLNDSIPFMGSYVDYMQYILRDSGIASLNFVSMSNASSEEFRLSPYTAGVRDVQTGVSHMGLADFWMTPDRLAMTTFTSPLYTEKMMLWVKNPKVDISFQSNIETTMMPFQASLWVLLFASIFLVGVLNIWFRPKSASPWKRGERTFAKKFKNGRWEKVSLTHRLRTLFGTLTVYFIDSSLGFFVGAINTGHDQPLPAKILSFGYGFLVLVTVAAYTANLVTFLTAPPHDFYYESMEMAIDHHAKICLQVDLLQTIQSQWPHAVFVPKENAKAMLEAFHIGECDAMIHSYYGLINNHGYTEAFCEADLVVTKSVVMAVEVALPVKQEIVAAISYWIQKGKMEGTEISDFNEKYRAPSTCRLELDTSSAVDDELKRLSISEMTFPFFVFYLTASLAVIVKLWRYRKKTLRFLSPHSGLIHNKEEDEDKSEEKENHQSLGRESIGGEDIFDDEENCGLQKGVHGKSPGATEDDMERFHARMLEINGQMQELLRAQQDLVRRPLSQ